MPKFQVGPIVADSRNESMKLGADTVANGGALADADLKKIVKQLGDSRFGLASVGDPIEAFLGAVENITQDGYSFGSIRKGGIHAVTCDGLQATPGTGTIAVGDYVVTGTPVAAGTALGTNVGPKVCKATYQPGTLADTAGEVVMNFPVDLANITDGDVVTAITPGFKFEVKSVTFVTNTPVTTAAKTTDLNVEIGTTDVTGGVATLTSANCTPLGAVVAATAITADNTGSATDTISIEASSTTAFVEGSGTIVVKLKNLDTYEAIAATSTKVAPAPGYRVAALTGDGSPGTVAIIESIYY